MSVAIPAADIPAYQAIVAAIREAVKSTGGQSESMARLVHQTIALTERYVAVVQLDQLPIDQRRVIELWHGLTPEGKLSAEGIAAMSGRTVDEVRELAVAAAFALGDWRPPTAPDPHPVGDLRNAVLMVENAQRVLLTSHAFRSGDRATKKAVDDVRWRLRDALGLMKLVVR